jgi:hypothetical protein
MIPEHIKEFVRNLCEHPETFEQFPLTMLDEPKDKKNEEGLCCYAVVFCQWEIREKPVMVSIPGWKDSRIVKNFIP